MNLLMKYYKEGAEVFRNVSDFTGYHQDGTRVFDVLQGTECGNDAVSGIKTLYFLCRGNKTVSNNKLKK